jgi:hypothetical protein
MGIEDSAASVEESTEPPLRGYHPTLEKNEKPRRSERLVKLKNPLGLQGDIATTSSSGSTTRLSSAVDSLQIHAYALSVETVAQLLDVDPK